MPNRTHTGTARKEFCSPLLWEQQDRVPVWKLPEDETFACIYEEDIPRLRQLLDTGPPPGVPEDLEYHPLGSPLHLASALGSLAAVEVILAAGVDPSLSARHDISPTMAGGFGGIPICLAITYGHRQVVSYLWQAMLTQSTLSRLRKPAEDCLFIAAQAGYADVMDVLCSSGYVWTQSAYERALCIASACFHVQVVEVLLTNRRAYQKFSQDALDRALVDAVGFNQLKKRGSHEPEAEAHPANQQALISLLIEKNGANPYTTTTGYAEIPLVICAAGDVNCTGALKTLLEHGVNPNMADHHEGLTALCAALGHPVYRPISKQLDDRQYVWNESAISILLEHGASVTARSKDGVTPLHLAARLSTRRILDILMSSVDHDEVSNQQMLEIRTEKQETLLHFAALGGRLELMEMLIEQGLDVNQQHATGWTPLLCALTPDSRLGDEKANILTEKTLSTAIRAANLLIARGADTRVRTEHGWTPLHVLSLHFSFGPHRGAKRLALSLLQDKAVRDLPPPNSIREYGRRQRNSLGIDHWQKYTERPGRNQTLLHWAARHCSYSVVEALLESGADPLVRDDHGRTPAMVAVEFGVHDDPRVSWQTGMESSMDPTLVNSTVGLLAAAGGGNGREEAVPEEEPKELCGPGAIGICKTCVNIRSRAMMATKRKAAGDPE